MQFLFLSVSLVCFVSWNYKGTLNEFLSFFFYYPEYLDPFLLNFPHLDITVDSQVDRNRAQLFKG